MQCKQLASSIEVTVTVALINPRRNNNLTTAAGVLVYESNRIESIHAELIMTPLHPSLNHY